MPQVLDAIGVLLISAGVMVVLLGFGRGLRGKVGVGKPPAAPPAEEAGRPEEAPEAASELEELARRVDEVIARHPEGIRLVEIGQELGLEWRLLIAPVNLLLRRGRIRKEDRTYYPL